MKSNKIGETGRGSITVTVTLALCRGHMAVLASLGLRIVAVQPLQVGRLLGEQSDDLAGGEYRRDLATTLIIRLVRAWLAQGGAA